MITIEQFMECSLRVAQILAAEPVTGSKKLLKLSLDLGEILGKRQIVAGIGKRYSCDELVGRKIVVVANLQSATVMGVESQGMLLASSTAAGDVCALVDPGQEAELGAVVR
jgi:methionyl-tRNA synthetase